MVIKKDHPNIKILEAAVDKLSSIIDEIVFLGAAPPAYSLPILPLRHLVSPMM